MGKMDDSTKVGAGAGLGATAGATVGFMLGGPIGGALGIVGAFITANEIVKDKTSSKKINKTWDF